MGIMAVPVLPRPAYEMRLAGRSNINSLRANHSNATTPDSLSQSDKGTYKRGGNDLLFQMYNNGFFPFSLSMFVSSIKRQTRIL